MARLLIQALHGRAEFVLTCTQDMCSLAHTILRLSANARINIFSLGKPACAPQQGKQRGYAAIKWTHIAEL